MLLAIDIGNTNTKLGVFDDDNLTSKISIPTTRELRARPAAGRNRTWRVTGGPFGTMVNGVGFVASENSLISSARLGGT